MGYWIFLSAAHGETAVRIYLIVQNKIIASFLALMSFLKL